MSNIKLVPSLQNEIEDNAAWCASFELAWQTFQNEYLENEFSYDENNKTIGYLVDECKREFNLDQKEYYVKSGKKTLDLRNEIMREIKRKFNTNSDILKNVRFSNDPNTNEFLIYSIICANFKFRRKFQIFPRKMWFRNDEKVKYFGIRHRLNFGLSDQVGVNFYNDKNDFAAFVKCASGRDNEKYIHFYRTDEKLTFKEAYNRVKGSCGRSAHEIINTFAVPKLKIDIFEQFGELSGETLIRKRDEEKFVVANAMQNLKIDLDRGGARVKSEAVLQPLLGAPYGARYEIKYYDLIFDGTFYMIVEENYRPVVALRVQDIKEFI